MELTEMELGEKQFRVGSRLKMLFTRPCEAKASLIYATLGTTKAITRQSFFH